jgi:hypothetical protein
LCLGASQQSAKAIKYQLQKSQQATTKITSSNNNKNTHNNKAGMEFLLLLVCTRLFWLSCLDFDFVIRSVGTINNSNQQQATKIINKLQQ